MQPVIAAHGVAEMITFAADVHTDREVLRYIARLAESTRRQPEVRLGVSIRGCLSLVRAAKAAAASVGRTYVTPDDIKALVLPVWSHRMLLTTDAEFEGRTSTDLLVRLLVEVAPPQ